MHLLLLIGFLPSLVLMNSAGPDSVRISQLSREALLLIRSNRPEQADSLLQSAWKIAGRDEKAATPWFFWALSEQSMQRKEYGNAYEYSARAVKSATEALGAANKKRLMLHHAKTCQVTGQFGASLEILDKLLAGAQSSHDAKLEILVHTARADVFDLAGKPDLAVKALEASLAVAVETADSAAQMMANYRLGKKHLSYERNFREVDRYLNTGYKFAEILGDTNIMTAALVDRAWNFYMEKLPDSALAYYKKAVNFALPGKRYYLLANAYGNIGTIFRDKGDYQKAMGFWRKGIETAALISDYYNPSWIYSDMSKMAESLGKFEEANRYQQLYKQFSDSLNKKKTEEGLLQARAQYDADAVKKKVEILSLRLKTQRLVIYGFAGFLVLLAVLAFLLVRQARMSARKRIAEMDQKILEITQANLRQQMNPHFIFNTLNSIQYYMYKHDKLATNNYLTKFSTLIRKILENSQHTAIPIRDEIEALQLYLELESIRFREKFDYEILVDEEIDTLMYKIPTMLIQPYVENAICHGLMYRKDKGKVKIELKLQDQHIAVIIEDNGIGRDAAREINRNKEKTHNSLGTRITESRIKLVSTLYGTSLKTTFTDLKDGEGQGAGTRVEIQIPILT